MKKIQVKDYNSLLEIWWLMDIQQSGKSGLSGRASPARYKMYDQILGPSPARISGLIFTRAYFRAFQKIAFTNRWSDI